MPFYDLKCKKCGEEFNKMAKISEREQNLITCPKCGSNKLDPIFTNVNYVVSSKKEGPSCPNIDRCGGCCGLN
ncbi:MAG TPA: zinc ribbon domain-containing protein [Clostridiales bacterium]|nr:zinc ribbon domain-containing protein [Clostridiales bacterium]